MGQFHFAAERLLNVPAAVVYHCLADYREHHRVGGFLPPAFTSLEVLTGGVGAGTRIRFTSRIAGRSQTRTQDVSEPEPGRVLVESGDGEGSTFSVEPRGTDHALLRIETVLRADGLAGLLMPLVMPRVMRPLYADEFERLEQHARAHPAIPDGALPVA